MGRSLLSTEPPALWPDPSWSLTSLPLLPQRLRI
jgi:hypothetical protein